MNLFMQMKVTCIVGTEDLIWATCFCIANNRPLTKASVTRYLKEQLARYGDDGNLKNEHWDMLFKHEMKQATELAKKWWPDMFETTDI